MILKSLLQFRKERKWKKFHSPQNIAKSIVIESAEILEIFQWQTNKSELTEKEKNHLAEELADVMNWLILLAYDQGIDLEKACLNKIKKNQKKYPINKYQGTI